MKRVRDDDAQVNAIATHDGRTPIGKLGAGDTRYEPALFDGATGARLYAQLAPPAAGTSHDAHSHSTADAQAQPAQPLLRYAPD
eukprot:CAMPEP_0198331618 /NCGR_PEP_ID=MMETSP1450-20131203/17712_1 /TAXON_ID=753684 ORGANISM="Madagascaria erythrocladiodes, Strain CCMP3234" /NCGR_SAMPLE_ID=MMETSP1450 /ASSEMBLY_ACC=CAM_ASM_001115 /LENGTH=83 /DNA_ID=CAMNT_0044036011 /DNA_START=132 /DNA_END=380 /DNA_ORIENTATION=+